MSIQKEIILIRKAAKRIGKNKPSARKFIKRVHKVIGVVP